MSRTLLAVPAVLTLCRLLASCGDPAARPSTDPTGTASDSPTDSGSEPSEPTEGDSEAEGERVYVDAGSIAVPEGWQRDERDPTLLTSPSGDSVVTLGDLGDVGPASLRQLARVGAPVSGVEDPRPTIDVEFDGEPGYAVRETQEAKAASHYLAGSVRDGIAVQLVATLTSRDFDSPDAKNAFLDEVIASYAWN